MEFGDFFAIYERNTWGTDVLNADKVAKMMMQKILNGDLSLYSHNNSFTIELPKGNLKIKLKAFNNYKNQNITGSEAFFAKSNDDEDSVIEIFIFEIYKKIKNFRGKKTEDLNNILYNFIKNNYGSQITQTLAHELEHAFESDKGIDMFESDEDREFKYSEYINSDAEINARIVEATYRVNASWAKESSSGTWHQKFNNNSIVKIEVMRIVSSFREFSLLTEKNKKRFIKGIYTTLTFLWEHYNDRSNTMVSQKDLAEFVKEI